MLSMTIHNLSDYHIHTRYSSDSSEEPENVVLAALKAGLSQICFTDHMDLDYPATKEYENPAFRFDIPAYYKELSLLRERYKDRLTVKIGMELGLAPYLKERNKALTRMADFDFIIGSTHLIDGQDPYYPSFWEGLHPDKVVEKYFLATLDNIKSFADFDVYGHLDYITRYVPDKNYAFSYRKHAGILDSVLKLLIEGGHGIELNTSPLYKGLSAPNPGRDILVRYRELGGEIITLGSDAHKAENTAACFPAARDILTDCGFKYYAVYEKRDLSFQKL